MTEPIRLPLLEELEPRLAESDKDSLASNVFYDKGRNGAIYANKRPGLEASVSGMGQAQGIFDTFSWNMPPFRYSVIWNGTKFCGVSNCSNEAFNALSRPKISITSTDGLTWQQGYMPSNHRWRGVAWNGTVFCAVGVNSSNIGVVCTSSDGISWTLRSIGVSSWQAVAANPATGRFVAVSADGTATYSTDNGVTWSAGTISFRLWRGVAWNSGAGVFCTVANTPTVVATSPDGVTWTDRVIASGERFDIASNGTLFVTTSLNSNKAYTSPDGITWTERTLPSTKLWLDVTWTGVHFITIASAIPENNFIGYVAYSTDGITWSQTTLPELNGVTEYGTVAGNSDIVVVLTGGEVSNQYSYSTDDNVSFLRYTLDRYYPYPIGTLPGGV